MSEFDDLLGGESLRREAVSASALGDMVGLSDRTIRDLAKRGVIDRCGAGFEPRDSILRYCAHLREQAAGRSNSANLTQERIRLAREQADAASLKNAVTRSEMVPAKDVESAWSAVLRDVRSAMLSLPARVQTRLGHLTSHDVAEIDREIRTVLEETTK